jgi:hypothetical protein
MMEEVLDVNADEETTILVKQVGEKSSTTKAETQLEVAENQTLVKRMKTNARARRAGRMKKLVKHDLRSTKALSTVSKRTTCTEDTKAAAIAVAEERSTVGVAEAGKDAGFDEAQPFDEPEQRREVAEETSTDGQSPIVNEEDPVSPKQMPEAKLVVASKEEPPSRCSSGVETAANASSKEDFAPNPRTRRMNRLGNSKTRHVQSLLNKRREIVG